MQLDAQTMGSALEATQTTGSTLESSWTTGSTPRPLEALWSLLSFLGLLSTPTCQLLLLFVSILEFLCPS